MKRVSRSTVMAAFVAALLLLWVSSSFATTIFQQNYDSDALGTNPGWGTVTPAGGFATSVVNTESTSSPNSLNLKNSTGEYNTAYREFAATTEDPAAVRIGFDIKWVPGDPTREVWGWRFFAGSWVGQGYIHDASTYIMGGHMVWNGGPGFGFYAYNPVSGSLEPILSFSTSDDIPNNWFHVDALLHYSGTANQKYDVTITRVADGLSGTKTGVSFNNPSTPNQVGAVWIDNVQPNSAIEDLYLDNLTVETVPVPEPASLMGLAAGALGLLVRRHRRGSFGGGG